MTPVDYIKENPGTVAVTIDMRGVRQAWPVLPAYSYGLFTALDESGMSLGASIPATSVRFSLRGPAIATADGEVAA